MFKQVDDVSLTVAKPRAMPVYGYPFGNSTTPDNYSRTINRPMAIRPRYFSRVTARRTILRNLLLESNTLNDGGAWTAFRVTPETNATLAPNGLVAWRLREDASNDSHFIEQAGVAIAAGKVVRYIIAKPDQRTRLELSMIGDVSVAVGFDLVSGETYPNTLGMDAPESAIIFPIPDTDGWWFLGMKQTFATGLTVQTLLATAAGVNYTGDDTSGLYVACDHVLNRETYGPIFQTLGEARSISAPDLDPGDALNEPDPFAFLLEETPPAPDPVGRYVWDRVFGRVPLRQAVPVSLTISKPAVPGEGDLPRLIGDYFVKQQFLPNIWDAYFRVPTAGDSGVPAFYPTAGTYQLGYDGDLTGPLAFDAVAADVETELNALPSIIAMGGVTVTGSYNDPAGFIITWNAYAAATIDDTGLTAAAGVTIASSVTTSVAGFVQLCEIGAAQDEVGTVATDSFAPAGATPMTYNQQGNEGGFDVYMGNYLNSTAATSGQFTITLWGDTTGPLNWNDSMATILAAVNALAAVAARGSYTALNIGPIHGVPVYRFYFSFPAITGGDYTLTMFGQTTGPIPYNANLADITTELNLLSEVTARGGVLASEYHPLGQLDPGPGNAYNGRQIFFKLQFGNQALTGDASGLTPPTTFGFFNGDGGIRQVQVFVMQSSASRVLNMPGHPIQTGQECFIPVSAAPGYIIVGSRVTRVDDNTVSYTVSTSDPDYLHPSVTEFDPLTKRGYRPGAATVPSLRTTDYFLPGVTIGINSQADIPVPPSESDTDTFLQRAFSGQGEINWQVGELTQYRGPIISQAKTTFSAADA